MKQTKLTLLISAACATVALATASLQAQTLPVTTGLQLWLKADAGVTTNASGVVTNWADQSGMGNDATSPDPTKAPTLQLNAFPNSLPTLRFAGGTRYLTCPNTTSLSSLGDNVTMLLVIEYDDMNNFRAGITKTMGGLPLPFDMWNVGSVNSGRTRFYSSTPGSHVFVDCTLTGPPALGIYNAFACTITNRVIDCYLNNIHSGNATFPPGGADGGGPLYIGSRDTLDTQLVGGLAEVLIYQPALSAADLQNVINNYLGLRYNLPIDIPPTVSITSPTNGATAAAPGSVHVNITAAHASGGTVAQVNVYANGALLGGTSPAHPPQMQPRSTRTYTALHDTEHSLF
jgi:hypothetical protein